VPASTPTGGQNAFLRRAGSAGFHMLLRNRTRKWPPLFIWAIFSVG